MQLLTTTNKEFFMKTRTLITTGFALFFLGSSVFAQHCPGKEGGPGCFWKDMNLTTEQQEKLKALHEEMQVTRDKHKDEVMSVRKKISEELLKDAPSTTTLDGYAKELGDLHAKMTRERYDHLLKVKKILTPEQFKTMLSCHGVDENFGHQGKMGPGKEGCEGKHHEGCTKGESSKSCCPKGKVQ
jgi:Spy/CpxP family protein refolding chaperone